MKQTGLLPFSAHMSISRLLSLSNDRMRGYCNCALPQARQQPYLYKKRVAADPLSTLFTFYPGRNRLIYCLIGSEKTLRDFMLSGSIANVVSQSLFLICFFRNSSLLSFHVANADGYHSRVNTQGSWDAPQQLIAQTCSEGATEPGFLSHRRRKE